MDEIARKYQGTLNAVRDGSTDLKSFNFEIDNMSIQSKDRNELKRFRLGVAILNDQKSTDDAIIDYLLQEEIKLIENTTISLPNTTGLLSHLYTVNSEYSKIYRLYELVSLGGIERINLFALGIRSTFDYLLNSTLTLSESIIKEMGNKFENSLYDEYEITNWKKGQKQQFDFLSYPTSIEQAVIFCLATKESGLLKKFVNIWHNQKATWTQRDINNLVNSLQLIEDPLLSLDLLKSKSTLFNGGASNLFLVNELVRSFLITDNEEEALELVLSKFEVSKSNIYSNNLITQLFNILSFTENAKLNKEIAQIIKSKSKEIKLNVQNQNDLIKTQL